MKTTIYEVIFPDVRAVRMQDAVIKSLSRFTEFPDVAEKLLKSGTVMIKFENPKMGDLYFPAFLDADRTINLQKLELALNLSIRMMDSLIQDLGVKETRLNFYISGMLDYFSLRGVLEDKNKVKEESNFITSFVRGVLENQSVEISEDEKEKYKISIFLLE